ncbi:uncharacterized protein NECHADRAFT_86605 [Fusarium vanettenii 77-13-4]|uniref:Uncharacterized protein n=1 Tax=Fusarium vanettenii (strain ATCC MYA-4622 / CBS 123669 / FGSC 9596 / NRRL 45880 / 77-13-4) TaxID=660122 RepID=C7ZHD2_FUSV7|nr:uncharacterized protein NECHADRAFT_86605 [Fusarium vanettenii 77-13-4]EEU36662.1 predicted protein [Fusarium vanettenii 77-13-4]
MPCPSRDEIGFGPSSDPERWDRFFALSEDAINDALGKLFEQRKEHKELIYSGSPESGALKATVLQPMVRFEPEHEGCVTLVVPIHTGTIQHQDVTVDLEGWQLAVNVQLSSLLSPSDDAIKMENGTDRQPTKLLAGEYSIYRLFAALSEAPWTLNETSTLVQHENKGVPLLEHLENNVEPSKSALILEALKEWATNHETSDFYTLGLDLQLPTIQDDSLTPTHEATSLHVQLSYYVSDDEYDNAIDQGKEPQGSKQNRRGCLVFCEKINSRQPPESRELEFTANLANEQNKLVKQPGGALGTAAIRRAAFFGMYLLPELQQICAGIHLVPIEPLYKINHAKSGIMRYRIEPTIFDSKLSDAVSEKDRRLIAEARPSDPRDAFYAFERQQDTAWLWKKTSKAPGNRSSVHKFEDKWDAVYDMTTKTSVNVETFPGTSRVVLKAQSKFVSIYNQEDPRSMSNGWVGTSDEINIKFKLVIQLANDEGSGENGIITPVISNLNTATGLPSKYKLDIGYPYCNSMTLNGRVYQQEELLVKLMHMHRNLFSEMTNRFQRAGRFVAPGTSSLDFKDPKITHQGDLCWHLNYRPLSEGRVSVRP